MKVTINPLHTKNLVRGEVFSAERIEVRCDKLIVEGEGVDIAVPFVPGNMEVQVHTQLGIVLTLRERYKLQLASGLSIRSFPDGHLEIRAHRDYLLCVKVWKAWLACVEEVEDE